MIATSSARRCRPFLLLVALILSPCAFAAEGTLVFQGKEGPGKGKHIVLFAGDEEYRSEESLPMLAKLLAKHHGFKTTVVFPINKKTGEIDPETRDNIPGLEALDTADLLIIATRFRDPAPEQMKHFVAYVEAGKPIIGLRTATHGFDIQDKNSPYKKYAWNYGGGEYKDGFGRQILGETWVAHHGDHGKESTRGLVVEAVKDLPLLRGVKDVWGPTDVYTVRNLPDGSQPILMGQVLKGMNPSDPPLEGKKNDPMMPVAWIRTYTGADHNTGRVFTTTMGASLDFLNEGLRRLVVNAAYWAVGMENQIPAGGTNVDIVGEYKPLPFKFGGQKRGMKPADYAQGAEDLVAAASGAAAGGEISLFDGKSLAGWVKADGSPVTAGWSAQDGMLVRSGHGGDIYTDRSFGDFDLSLEWKLSPGVNSGIKYRLKSYGSERLGPEYQILDESNGGDGTGDIGSTASIYVLYPPSHSRVLKPAGEWNQTRIVSRGDHIEHWLNGVKVAEANVGDDSWRDHVARSKFAKREGFGQTHSSPIMLQDHGPSKGTTGADTLWFRNIVIKTPTGG